MLTYVSGDPRLTRAQTLAFGYNRLAKTEVGALETALQYQYPAAFASYRKLCHANRLSSGDYWVWRESSPRLMFMLVRESSMSATRLRYVQSAVMRLARDYRLDGVQSVALAPLGNALEWHDIKPVLETWLGKCALRVVVYEAFVAGVTADEDILE